MTAILVATVAALLFAAGQAQGASPAAAPGCSANPPATFSNNAATPIADNATTISTVTATGIGGTILDVDVNTNITHTNSADLDITLTSPAGTVVTLTTDNGGINDNVFAGTLWDDDADPGSPVPYGATNPNIVTDHTYTDLVPATPLSPEEPLSAFQGENPNGVWTLTVVDDTATNTGTLASWGVTVVTTQPQALSAAGSFPSSAPVAIPDNSTGQAQITVSG